MASIIDYIIWRGDLSFNEYSFNEIDGLILSQIAYIEIESFLFDTINQERTLKEIAIAYEIAYPERKSPSKEDSLINPLTEELLIAAANSKRFGTIKISDFTIIFNESKQEQFGAYTAKLEDNSRCIVYRGTDPSITGWKEDFNMCILNPIPSQKDALAYLEKTPHKLRGKIRIMGHSKGGNLAMYASAFCKPKIKKQIEAVYNYDGPGFLPEITNAPEYKENLARIKSYVPQTSLVGMILDHPKDFTIIYSTEKNGIMQHDPFSWVLKGPHFETLTERTSESIFMEKTTCAWLDKLDVEKRKTFLDTLYTIIDITETDSLDHLGDAWKKHSVAVLVALRNLDSETRKIVWKIIQLFFQAAHASMQQTNAIELFLKQFIR